MLNKQGNRSLLCCCVFSGSNRSARFADIRDESGRLRSSFGGANFSRPVRQCNFVVWSRLLDPETPPEDHRRGALRHRPTSHFRTNGKGNLDGSCLWRSLSTVDQDSIKDRRRRRIDVIGIWIEMLTGCCSLSETGWLRQRRNRRVSLRSRWQLLFPRTQSSIAGNDDNRNRLEQVADE